MCDRLFGLSGLHSPVFCLAQVLTIAKQSASINEPRLRRFLSVARKAVGLRGDISVLLTSSREMRQLNRCFRGKDRPTDVISFPAVEAVSDKLAGDLAISLDIAGANARALGHSLEDEVRVLMLHGLLHLAGYDHERDTGEMATEESRLREQLGLPSALIARTERKDNLRKKNKPRSSITRRRSR
jgi:probable rRNA maturation factor